jgi:ornithine cyclodeaminase/alanine dehydrogenase-like protein (mu-crystallin family)
VQAPDDGPAVGRRAAGLASEVREPPKEKAMTLVVSNEDLERVLSMDDALAVLEAMYRDYGAGRAVNGPRVDVVAASSTGDGQAAHYGLKTMAGVFPRSEVGAIRLNSDLVTWPVQDGLKRRVKVPAAPGGRWCGLVLLFSTRTGEPLMICPDGYLQRTRVAAANGLGARYLARADARTVGLLGSGWQAEGQLLAFCAVRPIERVRVYSPNADHCETFARQMSERLGIRVQAVGDPHAAMADADIVAGATNTLDAVLQADWLRPGVHGSAIKVQEVGLELLRRCDRVVFHTLKNVKQLTVWPDAEDEMSPEVSEGWWQERPADLWSRLSDLGQLVAGEVPGRVDDREVTFFMNNIGMGLQFAAVGAAAYERARSAGLGHELPTDWFTETVHP